MSKRNGALGMEHCTLVDLYHIVIIKHFKDYKRIRRVAVNSFLRADF